MHCLTQNTERHYHKTIFSLLKFERSLKKYFENNHFNRLVGDVKQHQGGGPECM